MNNSYLSKEAKAWIKRQIGPDEVVTVVPGDEHNGMVMNYELYTTYTQSPDYLGQILFDVQGYWIYDGELLSVAEQEQVAKFIINYVETV